MKLNPHDQEMLIKLLARFCDDIFAIEAEFGLTLNQSDLRPRIDYFHDAIRAFMAKPSEETRARLRIEKLSYDVAALRYLSEKPLASLADQAGMSPSMAMVKTIPSLVATAKKADRETKEKLGELYKQYGMLFAALLKPMADLDYLDRSERLSDEIGSLKNLLDALSGKGGNIEVITAHLDDHATQQEVLGFLKQSKGNQKAQLPALITKLKNNVKTKDAQHKAIDKAHHSYATTQLALYESAKDTLKKMASSGLNIVGAFVEASLKGSQQTRTR